MLLAAEYVQRLDPFKNQLPGSAVWSTLLAALPVLVLFYLLVPRRWLAPKAGLAATLAAWAIAVYPYGMDPGMAALSFVPGALFGLLPVGWTIFNAMLLYNITVHTGQFDNIRRSVAGLSGDARVQSILIGFAFGAFLEGAAGAGSPVAICGAMMIGLGFPPFLAAVLCLIANTSPVAYGGLGTPLITLTGVTGLDTDTLSIMAGHQLPLMSLFIPLYMVKVMCTWRQTLEVWPALLVGGGSFAGFQYLFATMHSFGGPQLWPMTDIGGGIFSLIVTAVFLRFWKPKKEWHFDKESAAKAETPPAGAAHLDPSDPHAAAALAALKTGQFAPPSDNRPLTAGRVTLAWMPFILMSVFLLLSGLLRQSEEEKLKKGNYVSMGPLQTLYMVPIPGLDNQVWRDRRLHDEAMGEPKPETARFKFAWLSAPGTAVLLASLCSMVLLRMSRQQIAAVLKRTAIQMKVPIPTIAFMLGLSSITRYAGMDATLGYAFANTGALYPYFAAMLGWLGVFLTGTDAGSNALFGSLQKITATELFKSGTFTHLDLPQAQVLICTANSTGGVMGKMIDAQSIVVATAATNQMGKEADIFKAVLWHSVLLASIVGLLTVLMAYVAPFTFLVPKHP